MMSVEVTQSQKFNHDDRTTCLVLFAFFLLYQSTNFYSYIGATSDKNFSQLIIAFWSLFTALLCLYRSHYFVAFYLTVLSLSISLICLFLSPYSVSFYLTILFLSLYLSSLLSDFIYNSVIHSHSACLSHYPVSITHIANLS